jgi:tetratricopeptide (TPR) repeat protein
MSSLFRKIFASKAAAPVAAVEPGADELYAQATAAYQAKDFSSAIPLYERVIALQPDHAEAYYKRGNALKDLGQLDAALASYSSAIRHKPDFQYAWCNRGAVQLGLGLHEAALDSFDQAVKLNPDDLIAQANRASLLQGMSRWEEALASHDRVLALNPQLFQSWCHRGNVLRQLGKPEPALQSYREALKYKPDYAEALYNSGVLLEHFQQRQAALDSYEGAIRSQPGFYQAHYNRAGVLRESQRLQEAVAAYDSTIAAKPDYPEAHANRGVILQKLERWDEALAAYDRALALRPDYVDCLVNRSTLFRAQFLWDAAMASCERALALGPDYPEAHFERASILAELARYTEAVAEYDQALALRPDFAEAHYNRALLLLLLGDYENGWASYEWRWRNVDRLGDSLDQRSFNKPLWLGGQPLAGKRLLIYCEQGFGDAIQFGRYAKSAADLGATVFIEAHPALKRLLESMNGVTQVIATGSELPEFDFCCPIMSLPAALKATLNNIPQTPSYLRSDPEKVAAWRARLGERRRPRIGLVWSGNPRQPNDRNRSFRLERLIEHLPREFDYVCLQKDIRTADEGTLAANPWISRHDKELRDFTDTAALCECLDLVISVCTSVAHLSGALGRPTWVLLTFNADWRWLLDRDDSPWYPTARLFRQRTNGDWNEMFARVATELRKSLPAA